MYAQCSFYILCALNWEFLHTEAKTMVLRIFIYLTEFRRIKINRIIISCGLIIFSSKTICRNLLSRTVVRVLQCVWARFEIKRF